LSWIVFSQIYFTFFMIYASRLRFYEPFFFNVVFCVCSLLIFFFSQPDVNITWITGHIHRSIVDKIDPTSEYVEMVKKIYIINYIGLHSFVKCDQKNLFNRKKYFWWTVTRTPPLFFNLKVRRMANYEICAGKLFTRSVCCFGFRLGIDFNW
jgi:hypothetical protein